MNEKKTNRRTKTKEKCSVCYGQIYENAEPARCSHDEERMVLGIMFAGPGWLEVAKGILVEDDFDIEEHRVVFGGMVDLFERGLLFKSPRIADARVCKVKEWLEERGRQVPLEYLATLEIGCIPGAVFSPESSPVSAIDVITYYAYSVKGKALGRRLHQSAIQPEEKRRTQRELEIVNDELKRTHTYWLLVNQDDAPGVPIWYSMMRPELRPTGERIDTLEELRAKYEIPHEVFVRGLASYPGVTRLLQINLYKQAKEKWPQVCQKDLLKDVFVDRALKPEPNGYGMSSEEFQEVMKGINSLQELCDYAVRRDSEEPIDWFDLSEWEACVEMLRKDGLGTEVDWERHRRNAERMRIDNIKANIYGIMEEEARTAMAKVEGKTRR